VDSDGVSSPHDACLVKNRNRFPHLIALEESFKLRIVSSNFVLGLSFVVEYPLRNRCLVYSLAFF